MLGVPGGLLGQVGAPSGSLAARYGRPTLVETNADGIETISFTTPDRFTITAAGRDGVALRVSYRKEGLAGPDVRRLLELNRGGAEWAAWPAPGEGSSAAWIRSDDLAMAELKGFELSVTAAGWNQPLPAEEAAPPPQPAAVVTTAPAIAEMPAQATVPALPPPPRAPPDRPEKPSLLPVSGDTREQAIARLGRPRGQIRSGSVEILDYDWGRVLLEKGIVSRLE
jgi:hypothetical protein